MVYLSNLLVMILICSLSPLSYSQSPPNKPARVANTPVNYDEALVGKYTLPDPLLLSNGKKVRDANTWTKNRRPEVLALFEEYQFGKVPAAPKEPSFKVFETGSALGGKAIRKQVRIYLGKDSADHKVDVLIYLPARRAKPSPLFLALSFVTNAMAVNDSAVKQSFAWVAGKRVSQTSSTFNKANPEKFIDAGIGYATLYYGDIEPDFKEGIKYGVRSLYMEPGQKSFAADEWGAISAWSWGLSRVMDYFEQETDIDAKRVALNGASRLGKTVLWTGARDQRFALIIPSISGEGGAALSRRNFGETVKMISDTGRYFYQFAANYQTYAERVHDLPMDSHMLIALIAPRPILLQTGDQDYFSDAKGEFLAAQAAEPVYRLLNKRGLGTGARFVAGDTGMLNTLGYYMHSGGHTILREDYDVFIEFIRKHFSLN